MSSHDGRPDNRQDGHNASPPELNRPADDPLQRLALGAPLTLGQMLSGRRRLGRVLSAQAGLSPVRIAVLGGSTSQELVEMLELQLLHSGFAPVFYQSEFGRYHVEAVHDSAGLAEFAPDLVYVHTSLHNVERFPEPESSEADLARCVEAELARFAEIWDAVARLGSRDRPACQVIQNNFELPPVSSLGSLDAALPGGRTRFVAELNRAFALAVGNRRDVLLQDVCGLSARLGLQRWFDEERWFSYKIVTTPEATFSLSISLAALVRALYGRARKVLVLDLDNTVWGGVVGDDGVEGLRIGRETPVAEAFTAFGEYCLGLRGRGVLLAACSKNEEAAALAGLLHPDSVLRREHFAAFRANWRPKPENLLSIAEELHLPPESFVFVDDNPAERALVAAQLPDVLVPELPEDVAGYPAAIEALRPFEQVALSHEDLRRAELYAGDRSRACFERGFGSYGDYLDSLEMVAEIEPLSRIYLERITQLVNKTNQFNLTTRRYTPAEMEAVLDDGSRVGLYGRLRDRFGENGLISVVVGRREGTLLELELWVMSCRVLKREVERAMLDALVEHARLLGVSTLRGRYIPTRRNGVVADHYAQLGFTLERRLADGTAEYRLELAGYRPRNRHVRVAELALGGRL